MPFISNTESRAQMQSMTVDDGSQIAEWDEVFDASVGFAIDEGLSISRGLNNEGYGERRDAAKVIFEGGADRSRYTDGFGEVDYNAMSADYPDAIKNDAKLDEEKTAMLKGRRDYYNDVMRRSDSTSAELLGSMNAFMLDPLNVMTMGIGTPFAVAKGVGVVGKAIKGALGAAAINAGTEALIQPFVLDYKLHIDSPYGMEDAIANIAMAAGGGLVLGGAVGGISGWLGKIRGEAEAVRGKLPDDVDVHEFNAGIEQIDEMIETLRANPDKIDLYEGFDDVTVKQEGLLGRGAIKLKDGTVLIDDSAVHAQQIAKLQDIGVAIDDIESGGFIRADGSYIEGSADTPRILEQEKARLEMENIVAGREGRRIERKQLKERNEEINAKQIESDAAYLRALEEEKTRINRTPDEPIEVKAKEIGDTELEAVYNAIDKPMVSVDGEFVDAAKLVKQFDDDIDALESMKVCLIG